MDEVLEATDLTHRYGTVTALDGVDLTVAAGRCTALLGPNGAGKTTLVSLITGLHAPLAGRVTVADGDPRQAATRRALGVVQQTVGVPKTLTVAELMQGAAVRAGQPVTAAGPALAEVGLGELGGRRAKKLSGGQRQRLQLAMALVGAPRLLVLDEPTNGLDVTARAEFWRILAARRDQGTAILLTTHLVEEAAAFADDVTVLDGGRVIAEGAPGVLADRLVDRTVRVRTRLHRDTVAGLPGVLTVGVESDGARLRCAATQPETLVRRLLELDPDLSDLRVEGASLEQALMAMVDASGPAAAA